ncbi:MAG: HyaD/HybD family hydrogenase maturation endopeptidase [Rhodocyclales bacterium]|nr:HyaD/HybD family hydrogenase maturation endopeptidase [Rhodocyclales bacterium]
MNCPASAAPFVGPTSVGQPRRAVVLGIGNTILTDEAAGVRAVEALERGWKLPANVLAIDGGTSGMEMIEDLSNLDFLIVLDVVKTGAAPGTVVKIAGDEIPVFFRSKLSPHQIALPDVLASLELLDTMPKEIVVLGVELISLELGMEMTPTVAEKVPVLAAMAAAELAARGYRLEASAAA